MALYESVVIARQDISASQVEALTDDLKKLIADNGGEVKSHEYWGLKNLAYRIKKNRKGHYFLLNLDAPAETVQEYERNMRFNEDILRYMTVRVDEIEEGPSAMMQSRDRRDDRGGRGDRGGYRGDRGDRGDRGGDRGGRRERGPEASESDSKGKEE